MHTKKEPNKVLLILGMSYFCSITELCKMFRRDNSRIRAIIRGEISIREKDGSVDIDLLQRLGYKLCNCCKERPIVKNPTSYVQLTKICHFCFTHETSDTLSEYIHNVPVNINFLQ